MQLRAEQLEAHLGKSLAAVYAIHGDEALLALEAADAVRSAARKRGFAEREVFEPGRSFDWSEFRHAAESMSLFGGKKVVELRLSSGKPALAVAKAIVEYCARPNPEVLLLLTMPRPEGAGWWKSEWFAALDGAGAIVEVQPVARAQLAAWLSQRLARQKQRASAEVLEFLAQRVEGNLLAAHQEVRKRAFTPAQVDEALDHAALADRAVKGVQRSDPWEEIIRLGLKLAHGSKG